MKMLKNCCQSLPLFKAATDMATHKLKSLTKQLSKSFLFDKVVACQFIPSGVSESQSKGGDVVPLDTASPPT